MAAPLGTAVDEAMDGPATSNCYWSTVNAGEILPGVSTPMNWSWYRDTNESCMRRVFREIGALARRELPVPSDPDRRFTGFFGGRAVVNVDMFRMLADRTPGTCGDAVERQFFGSVRPGVRPTPSYRRYPVVALRLPLAATTIRRRLDRSVRATRSWWRESLRCLDDAEVATAFAILDEAHRRYPAVMSVHLTCTMITQGLFDQLSRLATRAGQPGLEGVLTTASPDGLEETGVLARVWELSRGTGDLLEILDRYGYLGPAEISARSWREDPAPLLALCGHYSDLPDEAGPRAVAARQRAQRADAQEQLMQGLPAASRPAARLLLALTDRFLPTRESGRALMLMPVDVGRAALRRIGGHLTDIGVLDTPDDVFLLTLEELPRSAGGTGNLSELVQRRRCTRVRRQDRCLPEAWQGVPVAQTAAARQSVELRGQGVGPGVWEGTVRVVSDPWTDDLIPGEGLVCSATDPSWSALLAVAGALVVDIGGQLSHAAILAREIGLPCVMNTRTATRSLQTGDRVRVDGTAGIVTVLDRKSHPTPTRRTP